jgi:hypothetical protein
VSIMKKGRASMGMYDVVVFDAEYPGLPSPSGRFQTKAFDRCMDVYTVNKAGRLCLIGNELMSDEVPNRQDDSEGVDIDFHGDIRLVSEGDPGGEYVARFTHGTLEWIRPMNAQALSELALRKVKRREGHENTLQRSEDPARSGA